MRRTCGRRHIRRGISALFSAEIFTLGAAILGDFAVHNTPDWRTVLDFWFPLGLSADAKRLREMFFWWFGGGSNAALGQFTPLVSAATAGRLEDWRTAPQSRLALIIVLDQFPRGLFA